jgi:hypothetical protein
VKSTHAFCVGVGSVIGLYVAADARSPWWLLVPLLALMAIALFAGGADGWWDRAGRGLFAAIIAAVAAIATVFLLKSTGWFDSPGDGGGGWFLFVLALHAAIPAMLCGVSRAKLRAGFVAGFDLALIGVYLLGPGLSGFVIGLALLVAIGTSIGAAISLRD